LPTGRRSRAWGQAPEVIEDRSGLTPGARGVPLGWRKYEALGGRAAYDFTVVSDEGRRALDMKSARNHSTIARDARIDLATSPVQLSEEPERPRKGGGRGRKAPPQKK
jgi:hypothetical protein